MPTFTLCKLSTLSLVEIRPCNRATAPSPVEHLLDRYYSFSTRIEEYFHDVGGVLFRGYDFDSPKKLSQLSGLACGEPLSYFNGNSPRTQLQHGVYTATEVSPDRSISLHNELSYSALWPSRILFNCVAPASKGNIAWLADSRKILRSMSGDVIEAFERHGGVKYFRTMPMKSGIIKGWHSVFETTDRAIVSTDSARIGAKLLWHEDQSLTIEEIRPYCITHQRTAASVWFNQAEQFHPSSLPIAIREALSQLYDTHPERMPHYATFADGTTIGMPTIEAIRDTLAKETSTFSWEPGDVLMLDNVRIAHGRSAFKGARRMLVSLANDPH